MILHKIIFRQRTHIKVYNAHWTCDANWSRTILSFGIYNSFIQLSQVDAWKLFSRQSCNQASTIIGNETYCIRTAEKVTKLQDNTIVRGGQCSCKIEQRSRSPLLQNGARSFSRSFSKIYCRLYKT